MMDAALAYAARGWPVFPCSPTSRAPLLPRDKDERGIDIPNTGGVRKATTDPDQIRQWWSRWPRALIAAAAGQPIGAFVLDVDVKEDDGRATLALLEDRHGQLPETWEAATPSGGLHLYFQLPATPMRNRVGFATGLDVRTTGGSITLPPSRKPAGSYRWTRRPSLTPLAPAPQWLIGLIAPPEPPRAVYRPLNPRTADAYARAAINGECAEIAAMKPNTGRNQKLFRAAASLGGLIAAGAAHREDVEAALENAAMACGLHMDDGGMQGLRATIASGINRGLSNPRGQRADVSPQLRELQRRRGRA